MGPWTAKKYNSNRKIKKLFEQFNILWYLNFFFYFICSQNDLC